MIATLSPSRYFPTACILAVAATMATMLAFPYLVVLLPKIRETRLGLPVVAALGGVQTGVMCLLLGWVGLKLGQTTNMGAPVIRALLGDGQKPATRWLAAIFVGLVVGVVIVGLDRLAFLRFQPAKIQQMATTPAGWRGLLAAPYGGVVEEVMTRLFLTTLLVWLATRALGVTSPLVVVGAIVIAAALFAAGHLPATAQIVPLSPAVVTRAMVLNMLAGTAFGAIYWKWGIEHAIVAHFFADTVIHTIAG